MGPEKPRLPYRAALATLALGALSALLAIGPTPGLGLALVAFGTVAVGGFGNRAALDRWQLALLVAATALTLAPLLRDAGWLVAGDLAIAIVLAAIALSGARAFAVAFRAPISLLAYSLSAPAAALRGALERVPPAGGSAVPALRGVLIAGVLVTVFGALFASADGAFAQLVEGIVPATGAFERLPARLVAGLAAVMVAGGLLMAGRAAPREATTSIPERTLGPVEWTVALGAVIALFAAFVAVQFVVLFGGERHVLETAGLTYADYAREGFAQLLVVAGLSLALVAAARRWSRLKGPRHALILRWLLASICVLTLVVVLSALHRLDLYVDVFGATRLRLLAAVACALIGAVLVFVLAALVADRYAWLARGVVLLAACAAIAFTAANPDALIAERNVDRYERSGRIDIAYNAGLSADATPELATLPPELVGRVLERQGRRLAADEGLRGLNLARERARDALATSR